MSVDWIILIARYHGDQPLNSPVIVRRSMGLGDAGEVSSRLSSIGPEVVSSSWGEKLVVDRKISQLPQATRVCFTLGIVQRRGERRSTVTSAEDIGTVAGWVTVPLCNFDDALLSGTIELALWPNDSPNPLAPSQEAPNANCILIVEFPTFPNPLRFRPVAPFPLEVSSDPLLPESDIQLLDSILSKGFLSVRITTDPLLALTDEEVTTLWAFRAFCAVRRPSALPKLLLLVDCKLGLTLTTKGGDAHQEEEMLALLRLWRPIDPVDALEVSFLLLVTLLVIGKQIFPQGCTCFCGVSFGKSFF